MTRTTPKGAKRQQGTPASHVVLGALVIVLLLIVSALAKNAYKDGPVATPAPVEQVRHRVPAHQPAPPAEEPNQVPLEGGTM
jgi:hypothetical protein